MKRLLFTLLLFMALYGTAMAQLPELIYYQFEDGNTTVTNYASAPVGTNPAPINGLTTATGGFLGSMALSGSGGASASNRVLTGWNTRINGSFTLAFWTSNVPASTTLFYIFGDAGAGSFRCFTNGAAGAGNWLIRGGGLPDLAVTGAAGMAPRMIHAVYNASTGTYTSYVNGVQNTQVTVAAVPNITGTGLTLGAYSTNSGLSGLLDEFRWYNRALTLSEIQATYNIDLNMGGNCANAFSNFKIDNLTGTSARFTWTAGTGNNSYYLEYGAVGFVPGSGTKLTGTYPSSPTQLTISGLSPLTSYDVYFGEICNSGMDSVYFPTPQQFTTTRLCSPPGAFSVSNITANSAQFSWSYAGTANDFKIIYGAPGIDPATGAGTSYTALNSPATVSTLTGSTDYDAYIYADCGSTNGRSDTIGPISFRTSCIIASAPFVENFDGPSWVASGNNVGNQIDPCWTASPDMSMGTEPFKWIPRSTQPTSLNGPVVDYTGGNFMYVEASSPATAGDTAYLSTPPIDVSTLTTPALYFMQHRFSGGVIADMVVQVSNDFGSSWNQVYSVSGDIQTSANAPWVMEFVNLGAYVGDTIIVRFRQDYINCCGDAAIDSVSVAEAPLCPWPTDFQLLSATTNTATVGWNDPSGSLWRLEWGPTGFQMGTGTIVSTSSNPYVISSGLSPNMTYDVYLQTNCGANGLSTIIGPLSIQTQCVPFTAPYFNSFDNDSLAVIPNCWEAVNKVAGSTKGIVETYTFNGPFTPPHHVRLYNGSGSFTAGDTVMLVSPQFTDLSAGDKRIQFYARSAFSNNLELVIGTMSNYYDASTFTPLDTVLLNPTYAFYNIDFTAANGYNGTDQYIGLMHNHTFTFSTALIDNFFYEQIPACPGSLSNTLGMGGISDVSATATWSGGSGDITKIEWGIPGFLPGSGASIGGATVPGTATSFTMTGLTPQTTYEYYIQDSCNVSGPGNWVGPYTFSTLCSATPMPYYESFNIWPLACWENTRGSEMWTEYVGAGGDHYAEADFWSVSTGTFVLNSRPIAITQDAQIRFDWSHLYSTSYPNDQLLVLVQNVSAGSSGQYDTILDLIGPNKFNDPTATNTSPGQFITAEVILDPNKYTGDTIVVTLWGNSGFGPNLYINDFYVENAPSCAPPAAINAVGVLDTAATLSWTANPNAIQYQIWFGPQGFYQGTQTTAGVKSFHSGTSYLVDTLSDASCYEFLVRVICAPGDSSQWIGPVSFCTQCRPYAMPYYQSFDSWPPTCWDPNLGSIPWESSLTAPDNWAMADFWGNSSGDMIMSSPPVLISQNAQLRYTWSHLASVSYPDDELIVRATVAGSGVWDTLIVRKASLGNFNDPTAGNTSPGLGITDIFQLNPAVYNGNMAIIQFWGNTGFGPNLYIDDFYIETPPTCPLLSSLDTGTVTENSAVLFWMDNSTGSSTNYQVEYGGGPFGSSANMRMIFTNDTVNLTGLLGGSSYCYWVREICSVGDSSAWAGPFCFSTPCPTSYPAPYYANFEGINLGAFLDYTNCWSNSSNLIPRWESEDASGLNENSSGTGPLYDHTYFGQPGGVYMFMETSGAANGSSVDLISPTVNITPLTNPQLSFWYFMHGVAINKLVVLIDNGTGWVAIDSIVGQQQPAQSDPWGYRAIPLTAYTGNVKVAFRGYAGSTFTADIALDDVRFEEQPSCPDPLNLTVGTISGTSANLSWTASPNAQSYLVNYGQAGFSPGIGTTVSVNGTSTTISGLVKNNLAVEAYVRAYCGPGDSSNWVGPVSIMLPPVPCDDMEVYNTGLIDGQSALLLGWAGAGGDGAISTTYASSGTKSLRIHDSGPSGFSDIVAVFDSSYTSGIHNVQFDFYIPAGFGGYYNILHNYTGAVNVWAIEVYLDMGGTATVNMGTNGTGVIGTYNFNIGAWNTVEHVIDLDNDTAWILINGGNPMLGWQFSLGSTNMADRFNAVNLYSAANVGQTPNIYFDDFCVLPYVPAVGCDDPSALSSSNIGCGGAVLSWSSSNSRAGSLVAYGPAGFNPASGGTIVAASNSTLSLSGLSGGTTYDFYVVDICNNGDTSNVVGPASFTTLNGPKSAAFTFSAGAATPVNLLVSFNASASVGASSYIWDFGDGSTATSNSPTINHSYNLNKIYLVCLTIDGACGRDSVCDSVMVKGINLPENSLASSLQVYPSPATDLLRISFQGVAGIVEFSISDLSGKQIMLQRETIDQNEYQTTLNISGLSKGVYMLNIINGQEKIVRPILIE